MNYALSAMAGLTLAGLAAVYASYRTVKPPPEPNPILDTGPKQIRIIPIVPTPAPTPTPLPSPSLATPSASASVAVAAPPVRQPEIQMRVERESNVCTRHGMHKVITHGGRSWRCRR